MHCSIERCLQMRRLIELFISFLSRQPLAAPKNMSPTRTGNPIYDFHEIFNFSNRSTTGFGI